MFEPRLSRHAIRQLRTRGIHQPVVRLAVRHGSFEIDGRPDRHRCVVDAAAAARCPELRRSLGLVVVVGADWTVVTAFWDRPRRRAA